MQQAMLPGETERDSHLLKIGDTVIIKTTSSQTGYTFAWKGRDRLPRPGRREYTKFTKDSFDYDEARGLFSFSKSTGLPQRFRFGVGIRDIFFLAVPVPTDLCGMTLFPRFCVQEDSSGVMAAFKKTEYSCSKGIITPDNAFEHICCDIVNFLSLSESCKGVNPALFVSEIRHAGRVENDTCLLCRALQVRAEASAALFVTASVLYCNAALAFISSTSRRSLSMSSCSFFFRRAISSVAAIASALALAFLAFRSCSYLSAASLSCLSLRRQVHRGQV